MTCKHCGSDVRGVDPTIGAHQICAVAVRRGSALPYLGSKCQPCEGTGLRPGQPSVLPMSQTNKQFENMMDALHCPECKGTGTIKDGPMWPNGLHPNK